jgi:hypothetical protein
MMIRLIRWLVTVAAAAGALLSAAPAGAAAAPRPVVLDHVQIRYLPPGLGHSTSFAYRFERVGFHARVWESGSDAKGWRVDLDVAVMRGHRLSSGRALHHWFIRYEDRPSKEAHYVRVRIHGRPGWVCRDEVFWLARPGLAVSVLVDRARWTRHDALRIARSVRTKAA